MLRGAPIAVLCLGAILLSACGSTQEGKQASDGGEQKSPLLGGLASFESPAEVREKLEPTLLPWKVVEESAPTTSAKRPPFRQFVVTVSGYSDLGQGGELKLRFFNDRLMEARFFPKDPERYLLAFRESQGIDLASTTEASVPPHTRVWASSEHDGQRYIGWADTRLEKEFDDWIRRYS